MPATGLNEVAATFTRTWCGPGTGRGASSYRRTSLPPYSWYRTAFTVSLLGYLLQNRSSYTINKSLRYRSNSGWFGDSRHIGWRRRVALSSPVGDVSDLGTVPRWILAGRI